MSMFPKQYLKKKLQPWCVLIVTIVTLKKVQEKGLRHHIRMKHRIFQLDEGDNIELDENNVKNKPVENPCPLCKEGVCGILNHIPKFRTQTNKR